MTEAVDHLIPISLIVSRLEGHRDELRRELAATPWWRWRRRTHLAGMAAAYSYEVEQVLEISGSWQPIWNQFGAGPRPAGTP